jgi:hypothetical protein
MKRHEFAAISLQPKEMNQSVRAMFRFLGPCFAAFLMLSSAVAEEDVDRIVVEKSQRRMDLMSGETVVRSYQIALGSAPEGDKQQEGDGKTPEGKYVIEGRNPSSDFHLSLKISYPMPPIGQRRPRATFHRAATSSFTVRPTGGCWRASRPAIGPAAASP